MSETFPSAVGVVDLMIGFPSADARRHYDFLRPQLRDAGSKEMAFPAEYMFKDVPDPADEGDDPIAATFAEMDRFGIETGLFGASPDALEAKRRDPKRVALSLEVDPNDVMGAIR